MIAKKSLAGIKLINLSLIIILITAFNICKAQNILDTGRYRTIRKDTINIKGVVYDSFDQPVKSKEVYTRMSGLYPVVTSTGDDGRFDLKGASPKDTLIVDLGGYEIKTPNNGSRYLEIYSPPLTPLNTISSTVTAVRKFKKNPPAVFKVSLVSGCILSISMLAEFKNGGKEGFLKFVQSNIKYPKKAIDNNIEGEVEVIFDIEKDGSLANVKLARGIGYGCDDEVINAVKKSPNWRPAMYGAQSQVNQSSVTINFKLTDK
jgi:TonB family protein